MTDVVVGCGKVLGAPVCDGVVSEGKALRVSRGWNAAACRGGLWPGSKARVVACANQSCAGRDACTGEAWFGGCGGVML